MATPRVTRSRASATPQPQPLEAAQHRPNFSRDSPQPEPVTQPRRRKTKQQDSMEPESDIDLRPITRLGAPTLYEDGEQRPPPRPPVPMFAAATRLQTARRFETAAAPPIGTAPVDPTGDVQPWSVTVFLHAVPRWVREASFARLSLAALLSVIIILGTLSAAMLTATHLPLGALGPARDSLLKDFRRSLGIPNYDIPPNSTVIDMLLWDKPITQEVIAQQEYWNRMFWNLLKAQNQITGEMHRDLHLQNETLSELVRILPSMIAVVERDGKLEIPEIFWDALLDKVGSDAASPLWENFLRLNNGWLQNQTSAIIDEKLDDLQTKRKLINRDEFTAILDRKQADIDTHLTSQLDAFRTKLLHDAQKEVQRQATLILESSPAYKISRAQLSTLALTNLLMNINEAQKDVNWLTRATDAVIDPRYTSKTRDNRKYETWYQWLYIKLMPAATPAYPPVMAMLGWDEAGQCWCTSVSKGETEAGQLGIKLGHTILPYKFYIEHVPARATLDIACTPREFEVWAQMNSTEEVKRVHDAMINDEYYYQYPSQNGPCGKPPRGEDTWVCILREDYSIHHHNHIQHWALPNSPGLNMTTNRLVVRAKNNWGADHTCFYRVRLTGKQINSTDPERPIQTLEPKEIDNSYMMKTIGVDRWQ